MTFTLSGMVTVLISSFSMKASSPILDTLDGMTTSAAVPLYFLSTPFSITNSSATDANVITSSASDCSAVYSDVMSLLASPVESANTPVAGVMPNAIIKLSAAVFLKFS